MHVGINSIYLLFARTVQVRLNFMLVCVRDRVALVCVCLFSGTFKSALMVSWHSEGLVPSLFRGFGCVTLVLRRQWSSTPSSVAVSNPVAVIFDQTLYCIQITKYKSHPNENFNVF